MERNAVGVLTSEHASLSSLDPAPHPWSTGTLPWALGTQDTAAGDCEAMGRASVGLSPARTPP